MNEVTKRASWDRKHPVGDREHQEQNGDGIRDAIGMKQWCALYVFLYSYGYSIYPSASGIALM